MFDQLFKSVALVVVSFLLKMALNAIGVEIDEVLFNTIVAGIVAFLLTLLGYEGARAIAPKRFKK